jgi:uncharacterized membrane protein
MKHKDKDDCKQEPTISRIEMKIDNIDEKIDRFIERIATLEASMGFIKGGVLYVIIPIVLCLVGAYIKNLF